MAAPADSFRLFRAFRGSFIAAGREPIRTANPGELGQRSSFFPFSPVFIEGSCGIWPLKPDCQVRIPSDRLYHNVDPWNLFGDSSLSLQPRAPKLGYLATLDSTREYSIQYRSVAWQSKCRESGLHRETSYRRRQTLSGREDS